MGISEVCSHISRKGSKVGSGQPMSPGARSDPSHGDQTEPPTAQPQPERRDRVATHQEEPIPSSSPVVTGPED
jgi:hypothetical protein